MPRGFCPLSNSVCVLPTGSFTGVCPSRMRLSIVVRSCFCRVCVRSAFLCQLHQKIMRRKQRILAFKGIIPTHSTRNSCIVPHITEVVLSLWCCGFIGVYQGGIRIEICIYCVDRRCSPEFGTIWDFVGYVLLRQVSSSDDIASRSA